MSEQAKTIKEEIIRTGQRLYERRLVVATSGNLSARLDTEHILVTATGTSLSNLNDDDIIAVSIHETREKNNRLSTEFPLHSLIYKHLPVRVVIHCHPPLVNGYFAVYDELKNLTFESKFYLGNIPVIKQDTPSITQPELVVDALKTNNLVVVKNHGVVSAGRGFNEAFNLIETLEEAVKIAAVARLFYKDSFDSLDGELKTSLTQEDTTYQMFSKEHIQRIVELVNQDTFIAQKGSELDLTLQLAIKLDEEADKVYKFIFEKGRVTGLEFDADAPFVISANRQVWEMIFLGKLEPFVATTQGKMKLKGDLGRLSRWYVPFSRLFELFRQVKIA